MYCNGWNRFKSFAIPHVIYGTYVDEAHQFFDYLMIRGGGVQLELRCPQRVGGIVADPQIDWSFDELLLELNSIDHKLQKSSPAPLQFTKKHSRYNL